MPSMRELFKEEVKGLTTGLYKKSKLYIESQGIINPPRLKALALSSPNSVADLVGITVAAALGIPISSANRPGDTIFTNTFFLNKPFIGLAGPMAERNTGIISPTRSYYVKPAPAPYEVINQIKDGIRTNPLGTLLTAAKNELRDGTIREIFAKRKPVKDKYGMLWQHVGTRAKPLSDRTAGGDGNGNIKFSTDFPVYQSEPDEIVHTLIPQFVGKNRKDALKRNVYVNQTSIQKREKSKLSKNGVSAWDRVNNKLLNGSFESVEKLDIDNESVNIPYVAFEFYGKTGKDAYILLPGTISGLSEDIAPTWNTYKYVGSPFNTYRYNGVERSIKFDLKLYAVSGVNRDHTDAKISIENSIKNLKLNLNKLRKTVFPDEDITEIQYGGETITNSYNPNLVYLTISGYYKKLLGFIDSLSFSVDDSTPWPTESENFDGVDKAPYPAVINASISMKILEQTSIENNKLKFNFTKQDEEVYPEFNPKLPPKPNLWHPEWALDA